ncbi:FIST signal transduction protein [Alteromonas sp. S015]|uniref:FIST signal transduction protein n=1 Tax=Alteromonas sp. S015 TaxID=3117401 RepID=UPI002FE329A4
MLIVYASVPFLTSPQLYLIVSDVCANCVGCSTAGEISDNRVTTNAISVVVVRFESSSYAKIHQTMLNDMSSSFETGQLIASRIEQKGLKGIYILAPGVEINGSALLKGITINLSQNVGISGGLAGDDGAFEQTYVLHPNGIDSRSVVAVAFYGESLTFDYSARGGWRSFGPARRVASAKANLLFELDDKPALDIYKAYLGEYAEDLPASGLLFPFEVLDEHGEPTGIIRTILGVDEQSKSLVLAGEVNENQYLRLMNASTDDLISGAIDAIAPIVKKNQDEDSHSLALVTSCVGRKLVMGDRVEEEIEELNRQLSDNTNIAGFYSYGEISPSCSGSHCELHNQTFTLMLLREAH